MAMRGVQKTGAVTHTQAMLGVFAKDSQMRAEFWQLLGRER